MNDYYKTVFMNLSVMRDCKNGQPPLKPEFDFFSQFLNRQNLLDLGQINKGNYHSTLLKLSEACLHEFDTIIVNRVRICRYLFVCVNYSQNEQ